MSDLSHESMSDLIDELFRRTDSCVIVFEIPTRSGSSHTILRHAFDGGAVACIGLCRWAEQRFLEELEAPDDEHIDPEDDWIDGDRS